MWHTTKTFLQQAQPRMLALVYPGTWVTMEELQQPHMEMTALISCTLHLNITQAEGGGANIMATQKICDPAHNTQAYQGDEM